MHFLVDECADTVHMVLRLQTGKGEWAIDKRFGEKNKYYNGYDKKKKKHTCDIPLVFTRRDDEVCFEQGKIPLTKYNVEELIKRHEDISKIVLYKWHAYAANEYNSAFMEDLKIITPFEWIIEMTRRFINVYRKEGVIPVDQEETIAVAKQNGTFNNNNKYGLTEDPWGDNE